MINKITELFNIKYPIISGGMVWVSGGKLAAAVSNAGGLGLIGAGSMKPDLLDEHLKKALSLTDKPIGINLPLLYSDVEKQIEVALSHKIKIFFTSAGSPKVWTSKLKSSGAIVIHVTSTPELALKCAEAGVDGIVVEGFEAGGHNGREELTSLVLIEQTKQILHDKFPHLPLIAAGGFSSGRSILAGLTLGADAIQMGTRFLMTHESSAHENFKNYLLSKSSPSTKLLMRKTVPVRLFDNKFSKEIEDIEAKFLGDSLKNELQNHLGKGRAKNGMLLGDIDNGELEVGQVIASIKKIQSVDEVMKEIIQEFYEAKKQLASIQF